MQLANGTLADDRAQPLPTLRPEATVAQTEALEPLVVFQAREDTLKFFISKLAVIEGQETQTAELQSSPQSPQGPQIHLAVNDLQGGNRADGVPLRLQKQSEPGDLGVGQLKAPDAEFPPQRVALIPNRHEQRFQGNRRVARCGITSSHERKLPEDLLSVNAVLEVPLDGGTQGRPRLRAVLLVCLQELLKNGNHRGRSPLGFFFSFLCSWHFFLQRSIPLGF